MPLRAVCVANIDILSKLAKFREVNYSLSALKGLAKTLKRH